MGKDTKKQVKKVGLVTLYAPTPGVYRDFPTKQAERILAMEKSGWVRKDRPTTKEQKTDDTPKEGGK